MISEMIAKLKGKSTQEIALLTLELPNGNEFWLYCGYLGGMLTKGGIPDTPLLLAGRAWDFDEARKILVSIAGGTGETQ